MTPGGIGRANTVAGEQLIQLLKRMAKTTCQTEQTPDTGQLPPEEPGSGAARSGGSREEPHTAEGPQGHGHVVESWEEAEGSLSC